jgi:hypothetical protein
VAEKPGDVHECACAGPQQRGEGGTDKAGPRRREKRGTLGATARRLAIQACETEREGERAGEVTSADRLGPLGSERARKSGRSGLRQQVGLACQAERARGRTRVDLNGLPWAELAFSISLEFLMPFLFIFSRVFKSKFKLGFKFKSIQTCATLQRIF